MANNYQEVASGLTQQLEAHPEQLREILKQIIEIGSSLRLQVDIDTLLKRIVEASCKALGFRYSALYLDDGAGHFRVYATAGISQEDEAYLHSHPLPVAAIGMLINEQYQLSDSYFIPAEAQLWQNSEFASYFVVIDEDEQDEDVKQDTTPCPCNAWCKEDLIVIPLRSEDKTMLGFITPDAPLNDLRPTPEVMALFELFANQAAVVIEGARLHLGLRDALRQAQESEQIKNQFLATASHELRTPLTAIQGYLELLHLYYGTLDEDTKLRFLQSARRACDELVLLLGNVMDASRIDQDHVVMKLSQVQLLQAVQTILEILEPTITREKRSVEVAIPDTIVWVDDLRLRQVLLNLVGNALKYTPPGSPLRISSECLDVDTLFERLPSGAYRPTTDAQQFALIAIRDWGPGIAPEDQPRLFQKFTRLDEAINGQQRGVGLGLYLCRQLTEAMNGTIWMSSEGIPGEGSTFFIALPCYSQK